MCIKTTSIFKQTKKKVSEKTKKKVSDVMCEFFSQGYRFSMRLRGIGLRHLTLNTTTQSVIYVEHFDSLLFMRKKFSFSYVRIQKVFYK